MPNLYASLDALKERCNITRTDLDGQLLAILDNVSRQIDLWCNRQFFVSNRTWYYTYRRQPQWAFDLMVEDLLSVTTLKTDVDGLRTYTQTWAAGTDYELGPVDAPQQSPPSPYWQVARLWNSRRVWPVTTRGVQIVGKGGYYEVLEPNVGILAEAMDATTNALVVEDSTPFSVGQTVRIDDEQFYISAVDAEQLTLGPRIGLNGTTPASHLSGAAIDIYTYPVVAESCLTQAQRRFERSIGRPGRDIDPSLRAYASLDHDVQDALVLLRRWSV